MLKLVAFAQSYAAHSWYALRNREEGQTMAEYGVILAVITLAIVVAIGLLSGAIQRAITAVVSILDTGKAPAPAPAP